MAAVILLLGCFMGCGGNKTDGTPEVARYRNKVLTRKQLDLYLPSNVSPEDSTRFAKLFIEQWQREEAVVDVALSSIPNLEEQVESKVEDYRKKLIMFEYTSRLIADSLDSEVPESEIRQYYNQHLGEFISKENLYQYFYFSTAEETPRELKDWITSSQVRWVDSLREWASVHALEYKIDSNYVTESTIREVSKGYYGDLKNSGIGKLIRWNGVIQGQRRKYMFKLIDEVEPGDNVPFVLCKDKIRRILLNARKAQLIQNEEERILKDAKSSKYIQ